MLSSSFVEGRTKVIRLPEDVPKIILTLLKIFHHKIENLDHLNLEDLVKLVTVAEMRLCIPTLKPWVMMKLASASEALHASYSAYFLLPETVNEENVPVHKYQRMALLYVATAFRLDKLFWKLTRVLIYSSDTFIRSFEGASDLENSCEVKGLIEKSQMQYKAKFLEKIHQCIGPKCQPNSDMTRESEKYLYLMAQLMSHELAPYTEFSRSQTVRWMALTVQRIARELDTSETWKKLIKRDVVVFIVSATSPQTCKSVSMSLPEICRVFVLNAS
ncbi:hypothetical protein CLAIMM_10436 isoform 3 [Cladophialophora immunda]|nr:hypothetical protein CLAIMM_10436 isoform 3 [Cladophialophora immunda]